MSDDTPPLSRQTPRFVPTLTEIVAPPPPSSVSQLPSDESEWSSQPAGSLPDAAVMELLRRLGPELDARISETIAQVLYEQMPALNARLRQAVAEAVRETVASADSKDEAPNTGEKP